VHPQAIAVAGDRDKRRTEIVEVLVDPLRRLGDAPPATEVGVQVVARHDLPKVRGGTSPGKVEDKRRVAIEPRADG
jgi:hypothetical protein